MSDQTSTLLRHIDGAPFLSLPVVLSPDEFAIIVAGSHRAEGARVEVRHQSKSPEKMRAEAVKLIAGLLNWAHEAGIRIDGNRGEVR